MEPQPGISRRAQVAGFGLITLVVALLAFNVVWLVRNCNRLRAMGPGKKAPEFDLPTLAGDRVKLSDLKGRVVLLDFWGVDCPPCFTVLRHLKKLQKRFRGQPVSLLAIHTTGDERDKPRVRAAVAEIGLRVPVLYDSGGDVGEKYTVRVLPTTFLVDARGKIRKVWRGATASTDDLAAAITKALRN